MARAKDIIKLERDRSKALEEVRILTKRIDLKQREIEVLNDEIQYAIRYTTSPLAKQVKARLDEEREKRAGK